MRHWPHLASLYVQQAQGAQLLCADGLAYNYFCLGDTGAMFGHSPAPVAQAIAQQASRALTSMLPSVQTAEVGALLAATFSLPQWQMALTASDANRFLLRWARAVTQRPQLLVFDGCYHGAVDGTLVDLVDGRTVDRPSVLGQVHNHAAFTRIIPFNDLAALEAALADRQVACLLAEPALTNCGLVLPYPGFWAAAQALCQRYDTLLALADTLAAGLRALIATHGLGRSLAQLGARMELQHSAQPPRNAAEVHHASQPELDALLHLFMLNRGVLLTPFHSMLLVSPATTAADVKKVLDGLSAFLA
nr:aminotransferase class III-fold pyridoxal phosphate-dependent enzyme [uncultured Albidiferax sp.]